MSKGLKVAVIGGGSSYTPELVEGFIRYYDSLPVRELWLVDIEAGLWKLNIVGELAKRMVEKSGLPIEVHLTTDRRLAIAGADFVSTQMRVGMLEARGQDEAIPLKYGVIGQETTGPGGMMKALRTIPVLLDICRDIEELAPQAWLLNFTNPAGMVTEAIHKHSAVRSVGLCNAPIGLLKWLSGKYGTTTDRVYAEFVGLNHLHWVSRAEVDGVDRLPELLRGDDSFSAANVAAGEWDPDFIQGLHSLPSYYLKYYYMTDAMLAEQQESLRKNGNRAEVVKRVEAELFELYKNPGLSEKPKQLEQRGGAYYSEAAVNLMRSLYNSTGDVQTLNVANNGILDFLPDDACIEVNCLVTSQGPVPLQLTAVPEQAKGLIHAVKTYEALAIEAAVTGDRSLALQAMAHHPLVPSVSVAKLLLDEMLEANRSYLPRFFPI
ncbi:MULTISPECIES: 6-phospho-beta-glucosidase [unclassified Paenibacillus]|uniref:6-phospho-beta-glucosidase n=1 Tax=unclassified Paenibacillus TaxID=185978 RepID=UPI0009557170|nr:MULTISPECIES: 6-phospho-beta-glucosidase [unclassified Paenibacillus]ASS64895.1 6-phospho-beta-glucosidase [Paenibacillus sp. RUD330]SIR02302.1 6-phospho-beta-glucosidase [Paenibacillus sp. RU4X]SIR32797.1 6-phospho-beta-glucosidase [Paenibacillus sp. RU4T]